MIASVVTLAILFAPITADGGNLARLAEIEVQGPVRDLVLDLGSAGEARLEGELLPGERSRIVVPLPLGESSTQQSPEPRWSSSEEVAAPGRVRFLGWQEDRVGAEIERLPPGLRARTRPPMSPPDVRLPRPSLALLPALFVLGLALRRRAAASWLLATVGSTGVLVLGWPKGERLERKVTVLEIDSSSPAGLAVSATWERASIARGDLERSFVEASREGGRVLWTGSLALAGAWKVAARGEALFLISPFDSSEQVLRREGNDLRELQETWIREDGVWSAHGPWPLGTPLPSPLSSGEAGAPPGWLAAGLPQGVTVLIGRQIPSSNSGEALWIRQTGF